MNKDISFNSADETAIMNAMSAMRVRRYSLYEEFRSRYYKTGRDDVVLTRVTHVIDITMKNIQCGKLNREGGLLVVYGKSGSGKTRSLEFAFSQMPEIQHLLLRVTLPGSCTLLQLARYMLTTLGYPIQGEIKEHRALELLRHHLRERGIRYIYIDEFQHVTDRANQKELNKIADNVKHFIQDGTWPMGVFISGITDVSYFLSDKVQLGRRNLSLNMPAMDYKNNGPMVKDMVNELIRSWARLKCNNLVTTYSLNACFMQQAECLEP